MTKLLANQPGLLRIAKRLFWIPFLLLLPVFIVVGSSIPEVNHGSIGDGFRKLNVFLSAMFWISVVCWGPAFIVACIVDLPQVSRSRLLTYLAILAAFVLLALIAW